MVELLVVIAIMGILGALLSSALNHTRSRAHQIGCLANLRQLQVSWFMYADENDDQLPLNRSVASANERVFGRRNTTNSWVAGNPKEDTTTDNIAQGTLFPYTKNPYLYRCPADRSKVIGQEMLRTRSYSMSRYLNGDPALDRRIKTQYGNLVNPSLDKIFVFIEEHESSLWAGSFNVLPKDPLSDVTPAWTSTPSDRHNGGCNLSFADGHVEYWKWHTAQTIQLSSKPVLNQHEVRDLRRLQGSIPNP